MSDLVMPRLSDSMEEGTIVKWLKSVGDEVALGEELVEIETDKANMTYESDTAGVLSEIVAGEGETLPIGAIICRVGDEGDEPAKVEADEQGPTPASGTGNGQSPVPPMPIEERVPVVQASSGTRIKASPIARRMASDRGVELAALVGSGPGGRVVKADVELVAQEGGAGAGVGPATAAAPTPSTVAPTSIETAKGSVETIELTKLQQTVSRRMAESKAIAPHFHLQAEIDMTACVEARGRLKASAPEGEPVPTFNDMVVKACAIALREMPRANGAYKDGRIEQYSRVNIGVAVAAQDALVVPTVFDADQKGLKRISADTRALARKVRDETITSPELSGGTFTVSNLGMYGISNFHAVINTPQAAILAVGEVKEKPAIVDGEVVPRGLMGVTLACDHRILYGADGAVFLKRVCGLLEEPLGLAL